MRLNELERLILLVGAAMASSEFRTKLLASLPIDDVPLACRELWKALSAANKDDMAGLLGIVAEKRSSLLDTLLVSEQQAALARFCELEATALSHTRGIGPSEFMATLDVLRSRVAAKQAAIELARNGNGRKAE